MLSNDELLHYSRQIILSEIDEVGQEKLKASTVLIVGLGGLGSSCAFYLAAAGVGKIILMDFDKVESSNLQRQVIHSQSSIGISKVDSAKERLEQINPYIEIFALDQKADSESLKTIASEANVIVDCSDNYPTRYLLNDLSLQHQTPLVHASAIKFQGQLSTFNLSPGSPCYECLYQNSEHNEENCEDQGVFPPIVGVMGSLQASEALKIIIGLQALDGSLQTFDLLSNNNKVFKINKNLNCNSCGS